MVLEEQISYITRWWDILKKEGLLTSINRAFSFIKWLIYRNETLYLYRSTVAGNEAKLDSIDEPEGYTFKIITGIDQVKKLIDDGFQLDSFLLANDKRLRHGAIALCIFKEKQLVYMSWLAMTEKATNAVTDIPISIDFAAKEAYVARTFRNPKHWRTSGGFTLFMHFSILRYLRQRDYKTFLFVVDKNNLIMINTMFKRMHIKPHRLVRYKKLLWWEQWRESNP